MNRRRWLPLLGCALLVTCTERSLIEPPDDAVLPAPDSPPAAPLAVSLVQCRVSVRPVLVSCDASAEPGAEPGAATAQGTLILGGQHQYVRLASANPVYAAGEFTFDVTLENLIGQRLGTEDGATPAAAGIRVFFHSGPNVTAGAGDISVAADGTGDFTGANQPFYRYDQILEPAQTSPAKAWKLLVDPGVEAFTFSVYVAAPVQYPVGWVAVTPAAPVLPLAGGTATLAAEPRDWRGQPAAGTVSWSSADESVATVQPSTGVVTAVAAGSATITATEQGGAERTGTAVVTVHDGAVVNAVSPATLLPGGAATISGGGFDAVPGSNTVTIGGVAAPVTGGTTTSLQVTVPCVLSDAAAPIVVAAGGAPSPAFPHPLQAPQHALAAGAAAIVTAASDVGCNELTPTGTASRYVVAVYNTSGSPAANIAFELSADGAGTSVPQMVAVPTAAAPAASVAARTLVQREQAAAARADARHHELLEANAREYERLFRQFGGDDRTRPSMNVLAAAAEPPASHTIRVANIGGGSICQNYFTVEATRVYYAGKLAIYEDDDTPAGLKAANNATMAGYYQAIGDQYNADMEPIVRTNFGDPLRRDLDGNGVLIALFTPLLNTEFPNLAGFVVSCDQFPIDPVTNPTSNFGEYFYAMQPVNTDAGFGAGTADSWYRTIRATFIHETKHVASHAARVANAAPTFEASWLEEGTARHAEELWARAAVYDVAWKANTGYGSAADWNSIYCDVRPHIADCTAANARRPSLNMWRHFSTGGLYWWLGNSRTSSPFGTTSSDNGAGAGAAFYATSWSLVRYAIDRYAGSEAAFLSALNDATTNGTTNLSARAGVSLERLLGGWALALYTADYPGLTAPDADIGFPTWDLESIYTGLQADFGTGSYPRARHVVGSAQSFGSLAPIAVTGLSGGGVVYYEFSGEHAQAQLLRLTGAGGGALPSSLRIAIARIE